MEQNQNPQNQNQNQKQQKQNQQPQEKEKFERIDLIRDYVGSRVRMVFHQRDPAGSTITGIKEGQKGPFDRDEIVEGELILVDEKNRLWGIKTDEGEVKMKFLSSTGLVKLDTTLGMPSQWDGKQNGTYEIVKV